MIRVFGLLSALALCCLPAGGRLEADRSTSPSREVVVTLTSPATAGTTGAAGRTARLVVDREQARFAASLHATVPEARIRWRYTHVLNGAAVVLPQAAVPLLVKLPGVTAVDAGAAYTLASTTTADRGAARRRWQTGLPNQGEGMKIAIIDDGVDETHPYFAPTGYTMPTGFPKGQTEYTTAKVIVARAFAPANTTWRNARKPFDPGQSEHATHVAGIAAGNAGTLAGGIKVSGVAPRAYIGNYKALSVPTDAGVGLDGNAPEIVAAIEAAVADGMNVINLSIGEPEVEPSRDLVALALDGAARAGVIPVVAAGNDFDEFGQGSLSSPGTSSLAITVAAVTLPDPKGNSELADFSGSGPTPLSLRLKPDISAPGVSILSSLPEGRWASWSGTSMASPQIAGAAALLRERHPSWTVADLKAALIETGSDVSVGGKTAPPTRGGGGLADPERADAPLVVASPPSLSFGLVAPDVSIPAQIALADSGGGGGVWDVTVETTAAPAGAELVVAPTVSVPGVLELSAVTTAAAAEGDLTGFVRLTRGADVRRIPFWLHVGRPGLASAKPVPLTTTGLHAGNTRGKPARVSRYRYPDVPSDGSVTAVLRGPEQVFRVVLTGPAANFGVVITSRGKTVQVEPRVVSAGNENRLTGYAGLPVNLNPYLAEFGDPVLAAGAVRPRAGSYDVVFDSSTAANAGAYGFRFWINDVRPPTVHLARASVKRGVPLRISVSDAGSGVDPTTAKVTIDGSERQTTFGSGVLSVRTVGVKRGTHRLRLQVSDYQESRNMESVPPILPNTRVLTATIVIR
jgi:subtilisin family serine protease